MVLVGMHPVLTQVPPNSLRSMTATFFPTAARRRAKEGPAWPVPMTMASKGMGIGTGYLIFQSLILKGISLQKSGRKCPRGASIAFEALHRHDSISTGYPLRRGYVEDSHKKAKNV